MGKLMDPAKLHYPLKAPQEGRRFFTRNGGLRQVIPLPRSMVAQFTG